jgi:hypothetical protein
MDRYSTALSLLSGIELCQHSELLAACHPHSSSPCHNVSKGVKCRGILKYPGSGLRVTLIVIKHLINEHLVFPKKKKKLLTGNQMESGDKCSTNSTNFADVTNLTSTAPVPPATRVAFNAQSAL